MVLIQIPLQSWDISKSHFSHGTFYGNNNMEDDERPYIYRNEHLDEGGNKTTPYNTTPQKNILKTLDSKYNTATPHSLDHSPFCKHF